MLLVQSSVLQALSFMIFPIVQLTGGIVGSESAFCQASGFFLALGIETTDASAGLLAVHTALYIFRGGNGLYPFRRYAYVFFGAIPLLLASLAFLNHPGYVNTGAHCYLPSEPSWSASALSWIPRYVLLIILVLSYGSSYVYVSVLMKIFAASSNAQAGTIEPVNDDNGDIRDRSTTVATTQPVLPLVCGGSGSTLCSPEDDFKEECFPIGSGQDVANILSTQSPKQSVELPKTPHQAIPGGQLPARSRHVPSRRLTQQHRVEANVLPQTAAPIRPPPMVLHPPALSASPAVHAATISAALQAAVPPSMGQPAQSSPNMIQHPLCPHFWILGETVQVNNWYDRCRRRRGCRHVGAARRGRWNAVCP